MSAVQPSSDVRFCGVRNLYLQEVLSAEPAGSLAVPRTILLN
ncbi:hypothetical protein SAMN06266956_3775 [Paraburkholderia hospita]|nr:hypothetical protein SAMN06266956_3775 [Paraburkholderia hospita]